MGQEGGVADLVSPWKPAGRRREDRDLKREAVLTMAARLFVERGYGRAKLSDVADQLNITKPALYNYFSSKEDILLECYRLGWELVEAEIARIAAGAGSGLDKLRDFIRAYVRLMTTDFGAIMVRVDDRELSTERRAQVRRWKREIDGAIRGFLQAGIKDGSIRSLDRRAAGFAIAGALNWIGFWHRDDGAMTAAEIGDHFADLLTGGLPEAASATTTPNTKKRRGRTP